MAEQEVHHPRYGRGVVKRTRHKGFGLEVLFQDGIIRWVRADEVTSIIGKPLNPPVLPHPAAAFSSQAQLKPRKTIEALRLGIVPYDCVQDFTFGRDEELRAVKKWLRSSDESTLLIVGEYGSGKTHLLQYACGLALQEGFAVGLVELDPNEAPFHKPKRVYSHIIQNFKYRPRNGVGLRVFRDFMKDILSTHALADHLFFKHLIARTDDDTLWDWIEAREVAGRPWFYNIWNRPSLPSLCDYSTAANIYCYLLSAMGWAAKHVLGLEGLLLLFDEAETVHMASYSYQAEKSLNFLRALIRTANNDTRLLDAPSKTNLIYYKVQDHVPFLYKLPSNLKLIFAFTSLNWKNQFSRAGHCYWQYDEGASGIPEFKNVCTINLNPLTEQALQEAFEQICLLYQSSYNVLEKPQIIDVIFQKINAQGGRTRRFMKAAVEALDLARFNSGRPMDEVLQS